VLRLAASAGLICGAVMLLRRVRAGRILIASGAGLSLVITVLIMLNELTISAGQLSPTGSLFQGILFICSVVVISTVLTRSVGASL
jgi:hypothetical protein